MSKERFDTVVIGAGQAGLAIGYHLARQRSRFVIVDAGDWVGQSWDARWDSLRLFTPAHFTHLPGLRFPAQRRYRPSKGEMADYLRSYAARFALPVRLGWRVDQLSRDGDGYRICSAGRSLRADTVVVATGPAMRPRVPNVADKLDPAIRSLHSVDYRNPEQLRDGAVLIVGAGNSGAEIALDVAPTHQVILAGRDIGRLPISLGGAGLLAHEPAIDDQHQLRPEVCGQRSRGQGHSAGSGSPGRSGRSRRRARAARGRAGRRASAARGRART